MEKSELQKKVERWLTEQGYPLEMRTARTFKRRGWFLHHSRRYRDPNLGKEREIDVLAFHDDPSKTSKIHGHFVVECKWTPEKPWVLFTSELQSQTPFGHLMSTPMTESARRSVERLLPEDVSNLPLFSDIKEGYAIVQAFRKEAAIDAAYSAVQAAIGAADFFARSMSNKTSHSILYIPTVVLDGELFRCTLEEGAEVSLQQSDIECLIYDLAENPTMSATCVHIVRESVLNKFIDLAEISFSSLRAALKQRRLKNETSQEN